MLCVILSLNSWYKFLFSLTSYVLSPKTKFKTLMTKLMTEIITLMTKKLGKKVENKVELLGIAG